ncbi:hypothetical protein IWZ00DRAFT_250242 [Phyllosticta capitalensis]
MMRDWYPFPAPAQPPKVQACPPCVPRDHDDSLPTFGDAVDFYFAGSSKIRSFLLPRPPHPVTARRARVNRAQEGQALRARCRGIPDAEAMLNMLWTSPRHDRKLPTKGRHSCLFWEGRTVMLSLQTNVPVHGFPLCDNVPSRHAGPWIGVLGTRGAIVVLPSQPSRMERVWSGSQVRAQLPNDVTSLGPHKDKFPRARLKNLVSPRNSSYYGFGKTRAKLLSHMMLQQTFHGASKRSMT